MSPDGRRSQNLTTWFGPTYSTRNPLLRAVLTKTLTLAISPDVRVSALPNIAARVPDCSHLEALGERIAICHPAFSSGATRKSGTQGSWSDPASSSVLFARAVITPVSPLHGSAPRRSRRHKEDRRGDVIDEGQRDTLKPLKPLQVMRTSSEPGRQSRGDRRGQLWAGNPCRRRRRLFSSGPAEGRHRQGRGGT